MVTFMELGKFSAILWYFILLHIWQTCCWSDKVDWWALSAVHHLLLLERTSSDAHSKTVLHQRKKRAKGDNIGAAPSHIYFLGVVDVSIYHSPHNLHVFTVIFCECTYIQAIALSTISVTEIRGILHNGQGWWSEDHTEGWLLLNKHVLQRKQGLHIVTYIQFKVYSHVCNVKGAGHEYLIVCRHN